MSQPGIVGALLVDENGLPVSAKGTLREEGAGVVGDMARKAVKLSDRLTDGENPTIVVEFDTGSLLIKPQGCATLALQKST